MSTSNLAAGTPDYPGSSLVMTHPIRNFLIFLPLKPLWSKSLSLEASLARKGKVIAHLFLLLGNILTFYWWPLESGTNIRHHSRQYGGNFLRVVESVNGHQTHGGWDIIHPGLFTNKAIPATTQNWAKGCVPAPVSASLLSPRLHIPEWRRLCCFWLSAKDVPGSNPQPMTLQGWGINNSAPSSLGWDHFEPYVLHYDLTFPCGVSVTRSRKWIIIYLLLAASPSLLHCQMANGVSCVSQINYSHWNPFLSVIFRREANWERVAVREMDRGVQQDSVQARLSHHAVSLAAPCGEPYQHPCSSLLCMAMRRGWGAHVRAGLTAEMFGKGSPSWWCFLTSLSGNLIGTNSARASAGLWE